METVTLKELGSDNSLESITGGLMAFERRLLDSFYKRQSEIETTLSALSKVKCPGAAPYYKSLTDCNPPHHLVIA